MHYHERIRRAGTMAPLLQDCRYVFRTMRKNLGLTISLEVGYRLSPRGEAYLEAIRSRSGGAAGRG